MNLCSDGHDEVCYEVRNCPCCQISEDKDKEISSLEGELSVANGDIESLNAQLAEKGE